MNTETIFFWVIIDPLTFVLGSLGGFILFREIVELDQIHSFNEVLSVIKRRWLACTSLSIAIIYFFYRMVSLLNNN
jgi:hypothetical protein